MKTQPSIPAITHVVYVIQLPEDYKDRDFAGEYFCEFQEYDDILPVPLWTANPKLVKQGSYPEMKNIFDFLRFRGYPVELMMCQQTKTVVRVPKKKIREGNHRTL